MKAKKRLMNAINGEKVDRVPWSPNMAYWWENHEELHQMGEVAFLESIGADALIRGHYPIECGGSYEDLFLFKETMHTCQVTETISEDGLVKTIRYSTPIGIIYSEHTFCRESNTWFLSRHPVSDQQDYKILNYLKNDIQVEAYYDKYNDVCEKYGDRCLVLPLLVKDAKSSFQSLIEYWVGLETLIFALEDYPEIVEETLEIMRRVNREYVKCSLGAGAFAYITWEDSSSTLVSPKLYEKYIAPEINEWCDSIHEAGGLYIQHACGTLKSLAPVLKETKIDGIESISPPPTGDIEVWEMADLLHENTVMIGGIEPTCFAGLAGEAFESYVENLLVKMKNKRFVLANSDSCPPNVTMENFKAVASIVERTMKTSVKEAGAE